MFSTYILQSEQNGRYYIGQTDNIVKRLRQHNSGDSFSTRPYMPWTLVYEKRFTERIEAVQFERFIKKQKSRKFIEKLIAQYIHDAG